MSYLPDQFTVVPLPIPPGFCRTWKQITLSSLSPPFIVLLLIAIVSLGPSVMAQSYPSIDTYTFSGTNPNSGGGTVAASVTFSVTASGVVTIDLKNTYTSATATNTDVLEGVLFNTTLATKVGSTASGTWAQVATGSNLLRADGTIVGGAGTNLATNGTWAFANLGTGTTSDGLVHNYGIGDTGAYGISTGPGEGGIVSSATFPNGPGHAASTNANKDPWTDNEAIFNLSGITGLTNVNQITNVYFIYSSGGTASPKATLASTPEPGTSALFGALLLSSAVWLRKRKRAPR